MPTAPALQVHRIEVSAAPGHADPRAETLKRDAAAIGLPLANARTASVYLIEGALSAAAVELVRTRLLTDPVTETSRVGASPALPGSCIIEVHPLPGVMDPAAQSVREAIRDLLGADTSAVVSTGQRYDLAGLTREQADRLAAGLLANPVVHRVVTEPYLPDALPKGQPREQHVRSVPMLALDDAGLTKLSRDGHLFLSLDEMKAIQSYYRGLERDPREIELETLAQTWSEHCVHKTLKSRIEYSGTGSGDPIRWSGRPGHTAEQGASGSASVRIDNLLKSTVAAATHELVSEGLDWTLSVFVDNAGVIAFDEHHAVCVKVETHNHPSAIEPYGGAATGIGGCIRDVIGTGLGARPIASTDVFCVAPPATKDLPPGVLSPRRILSQVVAGVRDYGNRMGIPTVSGGVAFDDRYIGNPLVYCGCIGVMPRNRVKGEVKTGDLIVALGGRTGRDGIHGATFSSAELEHTSADEFAHAVQIGNAIEEKRVLDAIMRARDDAPHPLFNGLTDCGAGGFSSAVGEMGKDTGATVYLDRAPLKYDGLTATEIWISEAQERMVLAVPPANLDALWQICREEHVELAVLGEFAPPSGSRLGEPDLLLLHRGTEVGRISMHLLHEGIPTPRRAASWNAPRHSSRPGRATPPSPRPSLRDALLSLLAHPNIASKHWIIRQYDHEVRGNTILKPLVGPLGRGPGDAAIVQPVPGSPRALAISQGLQTGVGDPLIGGDPYLMVLAAVDECVRNLVCVGADPVRTAILDNFCWPSCGKPENLGALVRAAEGCYDAAKAYRTPFVSGKDSLNNQITIPGEGGAPPRTIEIPYTLLITGIAIVPDAARVVSMDAKSSGNLLVLVGPRPAAPSLGGSHIQQLFPGCIRDEEAGVPVTDLAVGPATARAVFDLIQRGLVCSAHDVSDGGALTAVAEMLIAGSTPGNPLGASLDVPPDFSALFGEEPSRYILEVRESDLAEMRAALARVPLQVLGRLNESGSLTIGGESLSVEEMAVTWRAPLDW